MIPAISVRDELDRIITGKIANKLDYLVISVNLCIVEMFLISIHRERVPDTTNIKKYCRIFGVNQIPKNCCFF